MTLDNWISENQHGGIRHRGSRLGCGGREHAHDPLLPHGIASSGHVWLHFALPANLVPWRR
jgi:hypothetical protein